MARLTATCKCGKPIAFANTQCKVCYDDMRHSKVIGERFGITTVVARHSPKQVLCVCDCGSKHLARLDHLKKSQKSCGCLQKRRRGRENHRYNQEWHSVIFGHRISIWRSQAKSRALAFNITLDYLESLWKSQEGKCFYSGRILTLETNQIDSLSLERIDSTKGYIAGNVAFISKTINMMKKNYPLSIFITVCRDIANHLENEKWPQIASK